MKRRIYLICQKKNFTKGSPEVISDGKGKILYAFGSNKGKKRAEKLVKELNKDYHKQPVHLREGIIKIGKEVRLWIEQLKKQ